MTLSERDHQKILDLIENPPAPNARLRAALAALSRFGIIRPAGVGIYGPVASHSPSVSNDVIESEYFAAKRSFLSSEISRILLNKKSVGVARSTNS
jgi:hypothetical protein